MGADSGAGAGGRGDRGDLDGHAPFCLDRRQRGTVMRYGPCLLRPLFGPSRPVAPLPSRVALRSQRRLTVPALRPPAALPPGLLGAAPGAVAVPAVTSAADHDLRAAARAHVQPAVRLNRNTPPAGALRAGGSQADCSAECESQPRSNPGSAEVVLRGPQLVPTSRGVLRGGQAQAERRNQSRGGSRSTRTGTTSPSSPGFGTRPRQQGNRTRKTQTSRIPRIQTSADTSARRSCWSRSRRRARGWASPRSC